MVIDTWVLSHIMMSSRCRFSQAKETCTVFPSLAASQTATEKFARQFIEFARKHDIDGLDIDWGRLLYHRYHAQNTQVSVVVMMIMITMLISLRSYERHLLRKHVSLNANVCY